jgi:hypothetical protein
MTARVWTIEELNRVHPLPEGWRWCLTLDKGKPFAMRKTVYAEVTIIDGRVEITVSPDDHPNVPDDVCLAVILASKGRDSFEHMANFVEGAAKSARDEANRSNDREEAIGFDARADERLAFSLLLRRGRV